MGSLTKRGSSRNPRNPGEKTLVHKYFSTLSLGHIYYCPIGRNKSHDQAQLQKVEKQTAPLLPVRGRIYSHFLQLTTSTVYKLIKLKKYFIRLCNAELLSNTGFIPRRVSENKIYLTQLLKRPPKPTVGYSYNHSKSSCKSASRHPWGSEGLSSRRPRHRRKST